MKKKTILPLTSPWNHIVVIGPMLALLLSACGGDSGNTSKAEVDNSGREVATLVDMGRCTSEREGDTVYVAEKLTDYLCQNNSWVDLSNVPYSASDEINASSGIEGPTSSSSGSEEDSPKDFVREDISVTGAAQSGELKKSPVTDTIYVYDGSNWIVAERETAIGLCQNSNAGVVSEFDGTYFICRNNAWEQASVLEYDTYGLMGGEGDIMAGTVNKDKYYVYDDSNWIVAERETAIGLCQNSNADVVSEFDGTYYICRNNAWEQATVLEYDTYGLTGGEGDVTAGVVNKDKYYVYENGAWRATANEVENNLGACVACREGEKQTLDSKYYICENKNWKQISTEEFGLGYCTMSNNGVVEKMNGVYYICKSKEWTTATTLEYDTYGLMGNEGDVKAGLVNTSNYYIYKNGKWLSTTAVVKNLGECTTAREGEVDKSGNTYYICKSEDWAIATTLEYDTYGKTCLTDGSIVSGEVIIVNRYVCDAGAFRVANRLEKNLDKGCVNYTEGREIRKTLSATQDSVYLCNNSLWTAVIEFVGEYGSLIDIRDGKIYKTIVIGEQIWMAENLNYSDSIYYHGMRRRSWCYNYSLDSCAKYGRFYTRAAAMDSAGTFATNGKNCSYDSACWPTYPVRGICPEGWHLPDTTEWKTLYSAMGSSPFAMQAKGFEKWPNATDAYGFSALPAGDYYDGFHGVPSYATFWTSSETYVGKSYNAYGWDLTSGGAYFNGGHEKSLARSVRCLQDSP